MRPRPLSVLSGSGSIFYFLIRKSFQKLKLKTVTKPISGSCQFRWKSIKAKAVPPQKNGKRRKKIKYGNMRIVMKIVLEF